MRTGSQSDQKHLRIRVVESGYGLSPVLEVLKSGDFFPCYFLPPFYEAGTKGTLRDRIVETRYLCREILVNLDVVFLGNYC